MLQLQLEEKNMDTRQRLTDDLKEAMRNSDNQKRDLLRAMMAAIKQVEIDERRPLDDNGVQSILTKQIKQRRETIADAQKAGRNDMTTIAQAEIALIETYLPQMMSRTEIEALVTATITELGVTDAKSMGRVMGKIMPLLKGKADSNLINQVVREKLNG